MTKSQFKRPLKVFYTDGIEHLRPIHSDVKYYSNGKAAYSLFYDGPNFIHYNFVTDPTEAEVLAVNFTLVCDDFVPGVRALTKHFTNLKLILISEVYHISEHLTGVKTVDIHKKLDQVNKDPSLPYIMLINMDNHWTVYKQRDLPGVYYSDYIFNTMVMLYKDKPYNIFDKLSHQGVHWWQKYDDNDTDGLRRENYKLHNLKELPNWHSISTLAGNGGVPKLYVSPSRKRYVERFNRHLSAYKDYHYNDDGIGYEYRDYLRNELQSLLSNYPGFLGDGSKNTFLVGEGVTPMQLVNSISHMNSPGNVPINNEYYRHSVLTINIETLTFSNHKFESPHCVTEKTFEAILKGHFPLTFAYQWFYKDLSEIYNIALPDWINYEFDSEPDNLRRWIRYKMEVTRVLNLGPEKLFGLRNSQIDMLINNREAILNNGLRSPTHELIANFLRYCQSLPDKPARAFISDILG